MQAALFINYENLLGHPREAKNTGAKGATLIINYENLLGHPREAKNTGAALATVH